MTTEGRCCPSGKCAKRFPGVLALDASRSRSCRGRCTRWSGRTGAGKSTLIKVLTGVYPGPTRARSSSPGKEWLSIEPMQAQRAGISTIYQEVNLIPLMSVARNLFLGREPRRVRAHRPGPDEQGAAKKRWRVSGYRPM